MPKFSKNKHFLPPDRGKKCLSFRNFSVLCFLETPVLRFALLPYSRRNQVVRTLLVTNKLIPSPPGRARSSRLQMFFKISVLKNFANFTGKHLRWSIFLIKLQALACNVIKKRPQHRCFPVKFEKFLKTPLFTEHLHCDCFFNVLCLLLMILSCHCSNCNRYVSEQPNLVPNSSFRYTRKAKKRFLFY